MSKSNLLLVTGALIMGTLFMWIVAGQNFATVDKLLSSSQSAAFAAHIESHGRDNMRLDLRYLVSELNRTFFQTWNWTQTLLIVLALVLIYTGKLDDRLARLAALAVLVLVLTMTLWLSPAMVQLGRALDFVPRDPTPPGLARFQQMHGVFVVLDGIKLGLLVFLAFRLVKPRA